MEKIKGYAGVGSFLIVGALIVGLSMSIVMAIFTGLIDRGIGGILLGILAVLVVYVVGFGWAFTGAVKRAVKL